MTVYSIPENTLREENVAHFSKKYKGPFEGHILHARKTYRFPVFFTI